MESKLLEIKTQYKSGVEDEPLSPTGQYLSGKTFCLSVIAVLESEIPIKDSRPIKDLFQQNILPMYPRLSSTMVVDTDGVPHWKRVEVNIEEHIIIPTFPTNLSLEEYDHLFNEYLTKITMDELPQDKPLWEIHIIKYSTTKAPGHFVFKFHHSIGDGFSLMSLLLSQVTRADDPSLPLDWPTIRPRSSQRNTCLSMCYNTTFDIGVNVYKSFVADDKTPIRSGNRSVNGMHISIAAFSMDHIKLIKTKLGVTVNDVIMSIVFLGTRLYMQEIGPMFGNSNSTALLLLNTRRTDAYIRDSKSNWGNRFAFLHIPLSTLSDQSVNAFDFLKGINKITNRKKNSLGVYLVDRVLDLMRKFRGLEAGAKFMDNITNKASIALSSMIGPAQKMALHGYPIKGIYFAISGFPMSLVVTTVSYMNTLRIAVGVERDFIDSQKMISCMENAFHIICKDCLETARD